jgi:hypothetical protein
MRGQHAAALEHGPRRRRAAVEADNQPDRVQANAVVVHVPGPAQVGSHEQGRIEPSGEEESVPAGNQAQGRHAVALDHARLAGPGRALARPFAGQAGGNQVRGRAEDVELAVDERYARGAARARGRARGEPRERRQRRPARSPTHRFFSRAASRMS